MDIQHIALVRAPTNAQGSGSRMLVSVSWAGIITHTFCVWLTEDIKLARDTVDERLIDRFKETVRVWIRLDNFGRCRISCLLRRIEKQTTRLKAKE